MTTTVDLLTAVAAHLAEFELPVTVSVQVVAGILGPQVTVQLSRHAPSAIVPLVILRYLAAPGQTREEVIV